MVEMKLQTPVTIGKNVFRATFEDKFFALGSCFADNIGGKMASLGFDI